MNNFSVEFTPILPAWMGFILLGVLVFFLWKESQRKLKYKSLRLLAQTAIIISLMGILFRPALQREQTSSSIILLTPNYDSKKVDSLLQTSDGLVLRHSNGTNPYRNSQLITANELEPLSSMVGFVVGEGLSTAILDQLTTHHFRYLAAAQPNGIIQLHIPDKIIVDQPQRISGLLKCTEKKLLQLVGPDGIEDSVTMAAGQNSFSLNFTPRQAGLMVYQLQRDGNSEPVPVEVIAEKKLRILFLQKYPTAESRTLKNFLAEKNHSIVLRNQISKGKYSYEFANAPAEKISSLSKTVLDQFDLLIADEATLSELSSFERTVFSTAVQDGLGIHVLLTGYSKNLNWLLPTPQKTKTDTINLSLSKTYTLPRFEFEWSEADGLNSLLITPSGSLSGYFFQGRGKIGVMVLPETYPIRVQGNEKDYASLWTNLISRTARAAVADRIEINNRFPYYPNEPISFSVISSGTPSARSQGLPVSLAENVSIDNVWSGRTWATKSGWNSITTQEDTLHYFVCSPENWNSLCIANQIKENRIQQGSTGTTSFTSTVYQEMHPLIFFLLFLLASGFLWLAPKL